MEGDLTLQKQVSTVPVSLHQRESVVLPVSVDKVWNTLREFKMNEIMPQKVNGTSFTSGGPGQVGSMIQVDWADGAKWTIRVNEISDWHHRFGYEVVSTEPAISTTSVVGLLSMQSVTLDGTTFLQWETEFSNDADAQVISDQKYKKQEFFNTILQNLKK